MIAVLEDDPRRLSAMSHAARTQLSGNAMQVFVSANELIEWLASSSASVQLLSLDCDLDATAISNGECGSGEDVAEYLAKMAPSFPVLIHSSNAMRAPAMHLELSMAGYRVRLCPFTSSAEWAADVQRELKATRQMREESGDAGVQ